MFGTRLRLFRLCGIPINVDPSWLIIFALLGWTLADFFADAVPGLEPAVSWTFGLGTALLFFTCIVLHELGHALVARSTGIPIRGITLFLFGGVAEMESEPPSAGKEFFMAIGGPVVSALLAVGCWALGVFGTQSGWERAVVVMFFYLAYINTALLVFNMVPAFPLDGGRVLRSALWAATGSLRKATRWAALGGQGFAWLLIGIGAINFLTGNPVGGMWLALIGLFLNGAARSSYQSVLIRQALEGEPVRRFMNTEPVMVPPDVGLGEWVEKYVYRQHHKAFPVVSGGRLEGIVTTQALSDIPRSEWGRHTVGEVMVRDLDAVTIGPATDALEALEKMQRTGSSRLLVVEGDRLLGIVSLKDLLRFLDLKLELEGEASEPRAQSPAQWPETSRREEHALR
ncbi:MAG: site-2 protease family protein [Planctomycetes bacterium]|nr:site-2 protease family protein [Planctomycetota bacterium]